MRVYRVVYVDGEVGRVEADGVEVTELAGLVFFRETMVRYQGKGEAIRAFPRQEFLWIAPGRWTLVDVQDEASE
jgi:hypothetical protein